MPIDYETLIHEPARRMDLEKPMTIEVTQQDGEFLIKLSRIITSMHVNLRTEKEAAEDGLALIARYRHAAYEKGQCDAVERLTGLGGGS